MEASSERDAKSAVRTVQILERLAEGGSPTLAELARDLGVPKSSLHVVVQTLIRRGWVQRDAAGRLSIGVRAVRVRDGVRRRRPGRGADGAGAGLARGRARRDRAPRPARRHRHRVPRQAGVDAAAAAVLGRRATACRRTPRRSARRCSPGWPTTSSRPTCRRGSSAITEPTITDAGRCGRSWPRSARGAGPSDEGENADGIACVAMALPLWPARRRTRCRARCRRAGSGPSGGWRRWVR